MQLWRIHIRPGGGGADPIASYALCLRKKIIGVGWQVNRQTTKPLSIEEYYKLCEEKYGDEWWNAKSNIDALGSMAIDDLVWMRSPKGVYHLCSIAGPWEYQDLPENKEADVVNVRPVKIAEVGVSAHVPGKVCFDLYKFVSR